MSATEIDNIAEYFAKARDYVSSLVRYTIIVNEQLREARDNPPAATVTALREKRAAILLETDRMRAHLSDLYAAAGTLHHRVTDIEVPAINLPALTLPGSNTMN